MCAVKRLNQVARNMGVSESVWFNFGMTWHDPENQKVWLDSCFSVLITTSMVKADMSHMNSNKATSRIK